MLFRNFGSKFNLQQNGHHWNAPVVLITMVQIPASYLIPSPRYAPSMLITMVEVSASYLIPSLRYLGQTFGLICMVTFLVIITRVTTDLLPHKHPHVHYLIVGSLEPLLGSHGRLATCRVGVQVTMEVRVRLEERRT